MYIRRQKLRIQMNGISQQNNVFSETENVGNEDDSSVKIENNVVFVRTKCLYYLGLVGFSTELFSGCICAAEFSDLGEKQV